MCAGSDISMKNTIRDPWSRYFAGTHVQHLEIVQKYKVLEEQIAEIDSADAEATKIRPSIYVMPLFIWYFHCNVDYVFFFRFLTHRLKLRFRPWYTDIERSQAHNYTQ